MEIVYLKNDDFEKEVMEYEGTALVDFFATWCGPCQMLSQVIEEMVSSHSELTDVKIVKIDVDENRTTAMNYSIMAVPTLIVVKNRQVVARHEGFATQEQLLELIK